MSLITIDSAKCNRDGFCVRACPVNIIAMEKGGFPIEVPGSAERCIRCGHCVAVCPTDALTNSLTPREDFLPLPEHRPDADQVEALLLSRRSLRDFKKSPIPREQLDRLMEVARRAPTASNSQQVSWTVIQDAERLKKVIDLTGKWLLTSPRLTLYAEAIAQGKDVVLRGGTTLAVAHAPKEYRWTDGDCAIALTYMEVLASSMGLGACWGGLVTSAADALPELATLLGVPEGSRVGGALMLGIPRHTHRLIPPRNPAKITWL